MRWVSQYTFPGFFSFLILIAISENLIRGFESQRRGSDVYSKKQVPELVKSSIDFDSRVPRVVGGRVARPKEYPYMVAIYHRVNSYTPVFVFTCGGSIYNKNYIVTAAHCLHENQKMIETKDLRIIIGQSQIRLLLREDSTELLPVSNAYGYHGFDKSESGLYFATGDIGMLKITKSFNYSTSVKKLRIASPNESTLDGIADVTGWGRTELYIPHRPSEPTELPVSLMLKTARLRMIPRQVCTLRHFAILPESILCVGSERLMDSQSACFGDSGGPLACMGPSGPYLCGIVSTGTGCGLRFTPAFYTDVSKYYYWIQNIGGAQ